MKINTFVTGCFTLLLLILVGCATHQPQPGQSAVVAVWDLEDLSPGDSPFPDMGELLSARIIQTIKDMNTSYTVVERERLLLALEELNLGTTEIADESTRLRLGKFVGARYMVFGGYIVVGNSMRLDLRLVDVETGAVLKTASRITEAGDLEAWLDAAANGAAELL